MERLSQIKSLINSGLWGSDNSEECDALQAALEELEALLADHMRRDAMRGRQTQTLGELQALLAVQETRLAASKEQHAVAGRQQAQLRSGFATKSAAQSGRFTLTQFLLGQLSDRLALLRQSASLDSDGLLPELEGSLSELRSAAAARRARSDEIESSLASRLAAAEKVSR